MIPSQKINCKDGKPVIKTIKIGTCVSVQGLFVASLSSGKIIVRVDNQDFIGYPVEYMTK